MKQLKYDKEDLQKLLAKVDQVVKQHDLDLSSGEDLSIGIMNLISIEEHLFFTAQKTGKKSYLDLLNEVRTMRVSLLKRIIKDYEGEQWCLSKHFLAASMRLIETGTKELKKGNKEDAWDLFGKAYKLYSLFWGINLKVVKVGQIDQVEQAKKISFVSDKENKSESVSVFSKLGSLVQKALDCCRE
jgi:hypothetical protein